MNIIELAKQAGFERLGHDDDDWVCYPEEIEAFAELVAAHEREECAKLCQRFSNRMMSAGECTDAIRARSKT